jgi:alpha-tubulin suppressor-like RCC1 family protein
MQNDGATWAWGVNRRGQLGDGTTNDNFVPINIVNNATAVSGSVPSHRYVNEAAAIRCLKV